MSTQILFRRALAEVAAANNPILADGEPGYEQDTGLFKIGDGITHWVDLPAINGDGGGGGGVTLPNGSMVMVEKAGINWPPRPSGGTSIRVHWVGGDVNSPPPGGISGHDIWSLPMVVGPQ